MICFPLFFTLKLYIALPSPPCPFLGIFLFHIRDFYSFLFFWLALLSALCVLVCVCVCLRNIGQIADLGILLSSSYTELSMRHLDRYRHLSFCNVPNSLSTVPCLLDRSRLLYTLVWHGVQLVAVIVF